ncbi:hypothetical protein IT568_05325 [bacterium]|nr:hypothetical protein [bacterium]
MRKIILVIFVLLLQVSFAQEMTLQQVLEKAKEQIKKQDEILQNYEIEMKTTEFTNEKGKVKFDTSYTEIQKFENGIQVNQKIKGTKEPKKNEKKESIGFDFYEIFNEKNNNYKLVKSKNDQEITLEVIPKQKSEENFKGYFYFLKSPFKFLRAELELDKNPSFVDKMQNRIVFGDFQGATIVKSMEVSVKASLIFVFSIDKTVKVEMNYK